ncbi:nucleoside deaminase [Candidatus Dependentiae bacterium]|nr:MAG: nucleoside deaminase [Candidatus Dependentiae bacterium]
MMNGNEYYMHKALELAKRASDSDEVPVGAVVVNQEGTIIGNGHNQVEAKKVQTAHAEVAAIEQAAQTIGDWRLDGCSIYITLEPCRMCMGLIQLSRLSRVIYAVKSPRFGYQLDNMAISSVYKKDVYIEQGVCAGEAQHVLKQFFQQKREKKDECKKARSGCDREGIDRAAK